MELGQHLELDPDLDFGQVRMFGNVLNLCVTVLMFDSGCMCAFGISLIAGS